MATFVNQKGIQPQPVPNAKPITSIDPDEYINQYLKQQMTPTEVPGQYVPNADNIGKAYDKGGLLGGLFGAVKEGAGAYGSYMGSSANTARQAAEEKDPYMRQALLDQYQNKKGTEAAQTQAYNELVKEKSKNALETIKYKGDVTQKEKDRDVQYAQLALDKKKSKTGDIINLAKEYNMPVETLTKLLDNPAQMALLKTKEPNLFAKIANLIPFRTKDNLKAAEIPKNTNVADITK